MNNADFILTDMGWARIQQQIMTLQDKVIDTGVQGDASSEILDRAFYNEFGTVNIPQRSFLRKTFLINDDKLRKKAIQAVREIMGTGGMVYSALWRLGLWTEGLIKKGIRNGGHFPNDPKTIKIKGSSKPLIDTAQMLGSIRFELKDI